jgi:hypothetical protein
MCKDRLSDEELEQAAGGTGKVDFPAFSYYCDYAPDDDTFATWLNKRGYVPCPHRTPRSASVCRSCLNLKILPK